MRPFDQPLLVATARAHYDQPHRAYHDAGHLDELLLLAATHTPDLDDAEQLALLFHDAVYVPGAGPGENERLSARLMEATLHALADRLPQWTADTVAKAARIVEATTHAAPPPDEAARVCDLDLWRLAAPWAEFQRHAEGIWREYGHLRGSRAAFVAARLAFYRMMLDKPALFATPYFRGRFEAAARANMRRALDAG
ncbi:MAG: metal-dependent phosphohydrolase [Alphaproteobacteria bacterium]|nr:metal-dependent phosphohydrolase [Alphaproteobacteria bacterium]